jgi:hypothetical protein
LLRDVQADDVIALARDHPRAAASLDDTPGILVQLQLAQFERRTFGNITLLFGI